VEGGAGFLEVEFVSPATLHHILNATKKFNSLKKFCVLWNMHTLDPVSAPMEHAFPVTRELGCIDLS
jgi:hypothetical protein